MRVRMKAAISGTRNGSHWPSVGGLIDLPASEAAALCKAGLAVPEPETAVETATPDGPEPVTEKRAPQRSRKRSGNG